MKKNIVITLSVIVIIISGVFYLGHDDTKYDKQREAHSKTSKQNKPATKSATSSSNKSTGTSDNVLNASGTDYNIRLAGGVGGVFAKPTPMTKIFDQATALDIVASVPTFNHSKLVRIYPEGDNWIVVVSVNGTDSTLKLTHYQNTLGLIEVKSGQSTTSYGMTIPDYYYEPFRQSEKDANAAFSSSIDAAQSSVSKMSASQAEDLAMTYFDSFKHSVTDGFQPQVKSSETHDDGSRFIVHIYDTPQHVIEFYVDKATMKVTSGNLNYQ